MTQRQRSTPPSALRLTIGLLLGLATACSDPKGRDALLNDRDPSTPEQDAGLRHDAGSTPADAGFQHVDPQASADAQISVEDAATDAGADDEQPDGGDSAASDAGGPADCWATAPDNDQDEDGFTPGQGDCNDCSPQINPAAFDFPGNTFDEDCRDGPASQPDNCEDALPLAPGTAVEAAQALGICQLSTPESEQWGLISARFTTADGLGELASPSQVGVLPDFGAAEPTAGSKMVALSSGVARAPDQPGYTSACDSFAPPCTCDPADSECMATCYVGEPAPPGYPKSSAECPAPPAGSVEPTIFDQAALELELRVPSNAHGLVFDSIFYTSEYPMWICQYNDFFVVFKYPLAEGSDDPNVLFDADGNPVGVNSGLLLVCDPSVQLVGAPRQFACEQGTSLLEGTGYGRTDVGCGFDEAGANAGAATGWLRTTVAVEPGEVVTLRFALWDTKDAVMDSTALFDNLTWLVDEPELETNPLELY